jgi:hypothetical protein
MKNFIMSLHRTTKNLSGKEQYSAMRRGAATRAFFVGCQRGAACWPGANPPAIC